MPPSSKADLAASPKPEGNARGPFARNDALEALARVQARRPLAVLAIALLTTLLAAIGASKLTLRTSLEELLPINKESVIVAEQVKKRLASSATLYIVAESRDTRALQRFVDALAPRLRALPPDEVGAIDDGPREALAFFDRHLALYAPLAEVRRARDAIVAHYEREVTRAAGLDLGLDDSSGAGSGESSGAGSGEPPLELTGKAIEARIARGRDELLRGRFPGGYYLAPEGDFVVIIVHTPVTAGDIEGTNALLAEVRGVIDALAPSSFAPDLRVTFAGNLMTGAEEYARIKGDLTHVGLLGVSMVLGVVLLFYLRLRALFAMALTALIGVTWTFGVTYLLIGHLNASTGFLTSIIVGNGINFGIIYMARYFEVRPAEPGEDATPAVLRTHEDTWRATLAAALAASVAYGSLVVTDFRGFKHFGVIGGAGMVLCWTVTYLFLPSILVVAERVARAGAVVAARLPFASPWLTRAGDLRDHFRGAYGRPFAYLAERFPRAILGAAAVSFVIACALTARYVSADPMEYDLANTRTIPRGGETPATRLAARVEALCSQGQDGLAIMVDRLDQVRPLRAALEAKRAAAAPGEEPFGRVITIYDLLPEDQEAKIALITEARGLLDRAHRHGMIAEEDWAVIARRLPAEGLRPLGVDDLPEQAARLFVESDGTRGRLVYIVPATGRSVWDGHYLLAWADSFRRTQLPDGSVIRGSGNAVIFADVLLTVVEDAPRAILAALVATLVIVVIAFRRAAPRAFVLGTLALGLVWMVAALTLRGARVTLPANGLPRLELHGLKLNFLSFIAMPITVGVGADYAINVVQRYVGGRGESVGDVIRGAGGAVILCSLTTTLGYIGLTFSINQATASFGYTAAAGEVSCLLAAVLVLPALLAYLEQRRRFKS